MPAYKEKTKNTWYVSFYFTDWTGTRKRHLRRGFKRQKDALEYEREFLVKQQGSPDMLFLLSMICTKRTARRESRKQQSPQESRYLKSTYSLILGICPLTKLPPQI